MIDTHASRASVSSDDAVREQHRRALRRDRIAGIVQPVAAIAALFLGWEAIVRLFSIPDYLLPGPTQVFEALRESWPLLWEHSLITLFEIVIGFTAAFFGGVAIAIGIGSFRPLERSVMPIILFLQVVPKSALAPLLIVWAGVGLASKIALVFLMCFFPIVVQMTAGIKSVSDHLMALSRSSSARWRDVFVHVTFPHSLPYLFAGVKISLTLAVVGAVVAEFIASSQGIGYLLLIAFGRLDTPLVLAGLVMITTIAMMLYSVASMLEKIVIPWHVSQRRLRDA